MWYPPWRLITLFVILVPSWLKQSLFVGRNENDGDEWISVLESLRVPCSDIICGADVVLPMHRWESSSEVWRRPTVLSEASGSIRACAFGGPTVKQTNKIKTWLSKIDVTRGQEGYSTSILVVTDVMWEHHLTCLTTCSVFALNVASVSSAERKKDSDMKNLKSSFHVTSLPKC